MQKKVQQQKVTRIGERTGSDHLYDGKPEGPRRSNIKNVAKGKRLPRRPM